MVRYFCVKISHLCSVMLVSSFLALKPGIIVRQIHLINWYWFSFQSAGSRLGEEIWVSKTAHHFIGCSDATKGRAGTPTCVAYSSFERHILFCFRRLPLLLSVSGCLLTVEHPFTRCQGRHRVESLSDDDRHQWGPEPAATRGK